MNEAPKEDEVSFFNDFYGEKINDNYNAFGRHEVTVFYDDKINKILVCGEEWDENVPFQSNNVYQKAEQYLTEKGLL